MAPGEFLGLGHSSESTGSVQVQTAVRKMWKEGEKTPTSALGNDQLSAEDRANARRSPGLDRVEGQVYCLTQRGL